MSIAQHIDVQRHTHALIKLHPLPPPPLGLELLKHRLHLDQQAKLRYPASSPHPCSLLPAQERQDRYRLSKRIHQTLIRAHLNRLLRLLRETWGPTWMQKLLRPQLRSRGLGRMLRFRL